MNPWKLTAVTMGLVMLTGVVTGLVIATWTGTGTDRRVEPDSPRRFVTRQAPPGTAQTLAPRPAASPTPLSSPAVPTSAAIVVCNQYAAQQTGEHDKTAEVVKDAAVGAVVGGAEGTGAGTLYGLNENRKRDQRYRDAYASCMRSRGYTG